jgi:hypothetical protein
VRDAQQSHTQRFGEQFAAPRGWICAARSDFSHGARLLPGFAREQNVHDF